MFKMNENKRIKQCVKQTRDKNRKKTQNKTKKEELRKSPLPAETWFKPLPHIALTLAIFFRVVSLIFKMVELKRRI